MLGVQKVAAFLVGSVDKTDPEDCTGTGQNVLALFFKKNEAWLLALVSSRKVGASKMPTSQLRE